MQNMWFVSKEIFRCNDGKSEMKGVIGVFTDRQNAIDFARQKIMDYVTDWNKNRRHDAITRYSTRIIEDFQDAGCGMFRSYNEDGDSCIRVRVYDLLVTTDADFA